MRKISSALIVWSVCAAGVIGQSAPAPRHVAAASGLDAIVLVKAGDTTAVVRVATGALETIKAGDFLGTTKATVKEIAAGRLVLDESFIDTDGKPNRALIIIKEGERGGTRYLQRAGEPAITGTRPLIVMPPAPEPAKPAPKKPPQL